MKFCKSIVLASLCVMLLFCTVAQAIDTTPFFKIARDWDSNPIKAKRTWVGELVCIQGEVFYINIMDDGDARIGFAGTNDMIDKKAVLYAFDFVGVPDELAELEKGQIVKIAGKITSLQEKDNVLIISLYPSQLMR